MSIDAVAAAQEPVVAAQVQASNTEDSTTDPVIIAPTTETSAAPTVEAASVSRSKSAKRKSALAFPKFNLFKKSVPVTTVVEMEEETDVADVPAAAAEAAEPEVKTDAEVEKKKEATSTKKNEGESSEDDEVKVAEGQDVANVENEPTVVADSEAVEVVAAANSSGDKTTKFNPVKMFRSWSKKGKEEAVVAAATDAGAALAVPLKEDVGGNDEEKTEEKEKDEEGKSGEQVIKTETTTASEEKSEKDKPKAFFKFHLFKKNEDTASATPIKEDKESIKNAESELPSSSMEKTEADSTLVVAAVTAAEAADTASSSSEAAPAESAPAEATTTQATTSEGAPPESSATSSPEEICEGEKKAAYESGESAKPDTLASTPVKAERRRTITFPKFQLFKKSTATESVDKNDETAAAVITIPEEAEETTLKSTTEEKSSVVDVAAEPSQAAETVALSTTAVEGQEEPKADEPITVVADEDQTKADDAAALSGPISSSTSPKPDRKIVFPKFSLFKKSEAAVPTPQSIPTKDVEEDKVVDADAGTEAVVVKTDVADEQTPIVIAEASNSAKPEATTEADSQKIVEVPKKFGLNIFKTLSRKKNEKKEDNVAAVPVEEVKVDVEGDEKAIAEEVEEDKGNKDVKVEAVVAIESIIAEVKTEDAAVSAPAAEEHTK